MDVIVELVDVSVLRQDRAILNQVNWKVNRGENWVILGLNGSGKTTLLNLLNGYIFPSKGQAKVLDFEFSRSPIKELRKRIGWVSSALQEDIPALSSPLEIVLSGKFASIGLWDDVDDKDMEKAEGILAQLGLASMARRPYQTLSQGERQKAMIGRALMNDPEILIFDEAFNGLDIFSCMTLEKLIADLSGPDRTFLFVTHSTEEILPMFNKVLLLRDGEVHSAGDLEKYITEENLQDFYGRAVEVFENNGRYFLAPTEV